MFYDVLILGAGASGLMVAAHLKTNNALIIEGNTKPAAKIKISGGGRCNITNKNLSTSSYLGNPSFIESVFSRFDNHDLLNFLESFGLNPIVRKEGQYFCPHNSDEIIEVLMKASKNIPISYDTHILDMDKKDEIFTVKTDRGLFRSKKVVVATGGLSFKKIGATDIGYKIADKFGHNVIEPMPALVGLTLQKEQFWMKELSGLSLPVSLRIGKHVLNGDLLFAHKGISGPAVLNSSIYWRQGKITIDFLPDHRLKSLLKNKKRSISAQLGLPKRFVKAFLQAVEVSDIPYAQMQEPMRQKLSTIKSFVFSPAGTFGYEKAEVTKGGIDTTLVDPNTMQSLIIPGLYFVGEVLDVTGKIGGYNLQWAFSSAAVTNIS